MGARTSKESKTELKSGVPPYVTLSRDQAEHVHDMPELMANISKVASSCMRFTGVVHAYIYRPHEGLALFSIVRMRLEDGQVAHIENVSDPYAPMEAQPRMEIEQGKLFENMRVNYPAGYRHV